MANPFIIRSISAAWSRETARAKTVLDLSCGGGRTSRMLAEKGFRVVATDYHPPPPLGDSIARVGGVDLNEPLPFKDRSFDAVNLIEVIEHIEHQPQLIREIARVLTERGVVVISTPNILNMFSRIRFAFTGFLRGRVRPLHYRFKPGRAHNIYLIHFYELYYLLFHAGLEIVEIGKTRVKFASLFFLIAFYPFLWFFSLFSVIFPEKDPVQRRLNWQILRLLNSPSLLLSDNIVVKARKTREHPQILQTLAEAPPEKRESLYKEFYEGHYGRIARDGARTPSPRRRQRIQTYRKMIGSGHESVLELGCGTADLTCALAGQGRRVVGSDISLIALRTARTRESAQPSKGGPRRSVAFVQMNATQLAFPEKSFDRVVSTSLIEHLHPRDIQPHLREVWRVLKPGGQYLVWCPNGLGHHEDRDHHLIMFSHRELMDQMNRVGFDGFRSLLFNRYPFYVDGKVKIFLEDLLVRLKINVLWSHIGVRNILLLARKNGARHDG